MNESREETFDRLARESLTKKPGQTAAELARSMGIVFDPSFRRSLKQGRRRQALHSVKGRYYAGGRARQKHLGLFAVGVLFLVIGIYAFMNGAVYALGLAVMGLIYVWLALRNVAKVDDNLDQALSELSDGLPDINDNQNV
jgi:hypothetical protein